jgi:hypothetical protein
MADFGRGIKAGVVTGIIYLVIAAILGAICYSFFYVPPFLYGAGLTLFTWRSLVDPSSVFDLLFQYIVRGLAFGVVFAALYSFLPGTASVKKGVVLSAFVWIVSAVGIIYMTPGWPSEGSLSWTYCGGGAIVLSSIWPALAGIISALVFGALTGLLWDRFRGKELAEEGKGRPVLLVSFILGGVIWALLAVVFLIGVVIRGDTPIQPGPLWWENLLFTSVVFLGLPGWVLTLVGWRKTKRGESGLKLGVAGGVIMALTGVMLLPGVLAITGGVFSERKPTDVPVTAKALVIDRIARTREQKKRTNMNRSLILLITSIIILAITIIVVCTISPTLTPIEIRDWYGLNATRDNLGSSYLLMNDLDYTTPGYEELASETANQGKGWQPIGTFSTQQNNADHSLLVFDGTFNGQGYEIRDLFINRSDEVAVGLFCVVGQEGVIKDVGVVNATVTGHALAGTLVGWNQGAVRNSYSTGNMTVDGLFVGGLGGLNVGSVSNSYSTGSVTGNGSVGGLIAQNLGTVSNSYSTGSVTGNYNVGGLVGWNFDTVSNSYSSANVTGTLSIGGLMGGNSGTVSNCYATNSVSGNSSIGGLVGDNSGAVSNSYFTGSVTGNYNVGGLVGDTFDGAVSNCYSTASVTGNASVGGLVGNSMRSIASNSFWDTETSGQNASDGGMGRTTAEMKSSVTFSEAAWNIIAVALGSTNTTYIWNIVDNVTYPFLSWQS